MQGEEGNFLILWPIREEFAPFSMEDKAIHTVPLLDDVERFLDFLPELSIAEILAQEEGLDHPSKLTECLVCRMLYITARKPPQNRIRICGSDAQSCGILDHLIVLLANHLPIDRFSQDLFEMGIVFLITSR